MQYKMNDASDNTY